MAPDSNSRTRTRTRTRTHTHTHTHTHTRTRTRAEPPRFLGEVVTDGEDGAGAAVTAESKLGELV